MDHAKEPQIDDYASIKDSSVTGPTPSHNVTFGWRKLRYQRLILNFVAALLLICWAGHQLINFTDQTTVESQFRTGSDLIQLMDLPSIYMPGKSENRLFRRLIVVGDVHGMKPSLIDLLEKIKFNKEHDHLILAGDMISKGPDSPGVVDLAMDLGVTCLRGNHEDSVLLAWEELKTEGHLLEKSAKFSHELHVESENGDRSYRRVHRYYSKESDRALAVALGEKRIQWLQNCPVILRVGDIEAMNEVVVVHAGLEPGVALKDQDPHAVMNMRSIKHGVPNEKPGKAWTKAWNKYQKSRNKSERQTVIYGHDARRGLKVKKYSIGLDSGCFKGNRLTAAIIEGGNTSHPYTLAHVSCPNGSKLRIN